MEQANNIKGNILVVDDLSFMREALKEILLSKGFSVCCEAENGQLGFELYKLRKPDLVLMDITMPILDGLSSLEKIREFDPDATVLMCSALGQEEYILKAIRLGAKDFIVKPFRAERILSAVGKALGYA